MAAAQRLGLAAEFTTDTDLPYPVEAAIRVDDQAQFHPRKYCIGLARAIDGGGSAVFERTQGPVDRRGRRPLHGRDRPRHDHRRLRRSRPPTCRSPTRGGFFARTHPMRSYALSARLDGPVPQGMYLSVDTPSRSVRSARMDGEEVVILGGEGHKVGQDPDTRERYAALEEWARQQFPVRSIDYRWSAQDYVPVDHVPFVGPVSPGRDRVLVATGFKKWGMSNGSAAGVMLADRIAGRENPFADFFDTNRLNPRQSVKELVKENANVVKRFVGDRLRTETRSVADLAPGEAAVLVEGTERVAVYRDEAGTRPRRLARVHPHGLHGHVEHGGDHVGLPVPRLPLHLRRRGDPGAGGKGPRAPGGRPVALAHPGQPASPGLLRRPPRPAPGAGRPPGRAWRTRRPARRCRRPPPGGGSPGRA